MLNFQYSIKCHDSVEVKFGKLIWYSTRSVILKSEIVNPKSKIKNRLDQDQAVLVARTRFESTCR